MLSQGDLCMCGFVCAFMCTSFCVKLHSMESDCQGYVANKNLTEPNLRVRNGESGK